MPSETYKRTWETYQDAWADVTSAQRRELLRRSVAEDVMFASPVTKQAGIEALTSHIEEFQQSYPGASFKTHTFLTHHEQAAAQWVMYANDGSELLRGVSAAKYGADDHLIELSGF